LSTIGEWKKWAENIVEIQGVNQNSEKAYAIPDYLSHDERSNYIFENTKQRLNEALNQPDVRIELLHGQYGRYFKDQYSQLLTVDKRFFISANSTGQLNIKYSMIFAQLLFLRHIQIH
jgi:hypothetical protein